MGKFMGDALARTAVACVAILLLAVLTTVGNSPPAIVAAAEAEEADQVAEPAPPANQTYTGSKRCASCHFKQFMSWKKTKHSKTFNLLPDEYKTDAKCLKCHSTGYGEETGFKDIESSSSLAGTTCEACHGPGSKHEAAAKPFAQKKLSADEEKLVRDTIWKMRPGIVCINCHKVQAHGESQTPPELRKK